MGIYVGIYVDDILICGETEDSITQVKNFLTSKYTMTDLAQAKRFLGLNITQLLNGIFLSCEDYINKLAMKYHLEHVRKATTPYLSGVKIDEIKSPKYTSPTEYRELIGKLLYASNTVRGDIAYITNKLARHFQQPDEIHFRYAKHVLRYLILTKHLGLLYKKGECNLEVYCTMKMI